jgi:polyferredoxin
MLLTGLSKIIAERFTNRRRREEFMNDAEQEHIKVLIILAIWLVVTLFVGMWLWNNVAVKLISVAKPMTSIWQLLGLVILVDLIHPSCC